MPTIKKLIALVENRRQEEFRDKTVDEARSIGNELLYLANDGGDMQFTEFAKICRGIASKIERFISVNGQNIGRSDIMPVMEAMSMAYTWLASVDRAPANGVVKIIEIARQTGELAISASDTASPKATSV